MGFLKTIKTPYEWTAPKKLDTIGEYFYRKKNEV
jgi:hypothetical protein